MEIKNTRNKIISGLIWVYLENISAQAVTFIVTIILARLLTPNDYGSIALVTVFINIANVFVNSSFSYALIQKKNADSLDYNSLFWFNVFVSITLYFILFFLAPIVANYYSYPILCPILRFLAIKIPISAYNSVQLANVAHDLRFRKSFLSTSGGAIISAFLGIFMAYNGYGIWALAVQNLSYTVLNTFFLLLIVEWKPKLIFSLNRLKQLLNFGWKLLFTGLMFTGYSEFTKLIIGKRYSAGDLGYYDKGQSFPRFIAQNIDSTINRVLFPTLSNNQDNMLKLLGMTRRAAKTSSFLMIPILIGLAFLAEPLVRLLLTDRWLPCVPYLQIICLSWCLQPIQSCSIQGIKAIGRSDVYLKIEICSKIMGLMLLSIAIFVFDSVLAIAICMFFSQIIAMIIYGVHSSRLIGYKFKNQLQDVFVPIILSISMCIFIYLAGLLIESPMQKMILQIFVGAVAYILMSYALKIEQFMYIIMMVMK